MIIRSNSLLTLVACLSLVMMAGCRTASTLENRNPSQSGYHPPSSGSEYTPGPAFDRSLEPVPDIPSGPKIPLAPPAASNNGRPLSLPSLPLRSDATPFQNRVTPWHGNEHMLTRDVELGTPVTPPRLFQTPKTRRTMIRKTQPKQVEPTHFKTMLDIRSSAVNRLESHKLASHKQSVVRVVKTALPSHYEFSKATRHAYQPVTLERPELIKEAARTSSLPMVKKVQVKRENTASAHDLPDYRAAHPMPLIEQNTETIGHLDDEQTLEMWPHLPGSQFQAVSALTRVTAGIELQKPSEVELKGITPLLPHWKAEMNPAKNLREVPKNKTPRLSSVPSLLIE